MSFQSNYGILFLLQNASHYAESLTWFSDYFRYAPVTDSCLIYAIRHEKTRSMELLYSYIIRQVLIAVIERFYYEIRCQVKPQIPTIS